MTFSYRRAVARSLCRMLLGPAILVFLLPAVVGAPPVVKVENIRRAFHNGEHNAFTDLARWNGRYWLAFRSCPDGHGIFPTSSVIVLSSDDTRTWTQVCRFAVAGRDLRDPHFLIFDNRLSVLVGTWDTSKNREWNAMLGYGVSTSDGANWSDPRPLEGTYGHFIWRCAARGGKAYLCARRWREHRPADSYSGLESALLESDDGVRWKFVSLFQETYGNETAFLFEADGEIVAVSRRQEARGRSMESSVLARSRPPYVEWTRSTLPGFVGGPLLARWNNRLVVGGRRQTPAGYRTHLMWLSGSDLLPMVELPSDGDNSYPGFVTLDDGRGLVSWYSSHEKGADGKEITAIYLAELSVGN